MNNEIETETEASTVADLREHIAGIPEEKRKAVIHAAFGYLLESKLGLVWKLAGAAIVGALAMFGLTSCTIEREQSDLLKQLQGLLIIVEDGK